MVKLGGGKRVVIHSGIFVENVVPPFFTLFVWVVGESSLVCYVWRLFGVVL